MFRLNWGHLFRHFIIRVNFSHLFALQHWFIQSYKYDMCKKINIYIYLCCQTINHIQNKSFCLHNIHVCIVYIYYAYIDTHTYSIYLENINMYIFI